MNWLKTNLENIKFQLKIGNKKESKACLNKRLEHLFKEIVDNHNYNKQELKVAFKHIELNENKIIDLKEKLENLEGRFRVLNNLEDSFRTIHESINTDFRNVFQRLGTLENNNIKFIDVSKALMFDSEFLIFKNELQKEISIQKGRITKQTNEQNKEIKRIDSNFHMIFQRLEELELK